MLESCAVDRLSLFVFLSLCLEFTRKSQALNLVRESLAREFFIRLSGVRIGRRTPRGRCAVEPPGPGSTPATTRVRVRRGACGGDGRDRERRFLTLFEQHACRHDHTREHRESLGHVILTTTTAPHSPVQYVYAPELTSVHSRVGCGCGMRAPFASRGAGFGCRLLVREDGRLRAPPHARHAADALYEWEQALPRRPDDP